MDSTSPDDGLAQLAMTQGGAFSRGQAIDAGLSNAVIGRRLSSGLWVPVHPTVYRAATTPETSSTRGHAAALHIGDPFAFSHTTAARLLGLDPRLVATSTWMTVPHS